MTGWQSLSVRDSHFQVGGWVLDNLPGIPADPSPNSSPSPESPVLFFPAGGVGDFVPLLLWSWRQLSWYPPLTCPLEKEEGGLGCYEALVPLASLCETPLHALRALSAQRLPASDLFL